MNKGSGKRVVRLRRRMFTLAIASIVPLAALAFASSAQATLKGILLPFAQCPTSTPGIELCLNAQTTSGQFTIGSTTVPINKTITLQGGAVPTGNPSNTGEYFLAPAKNGISLSKTELNVPGGLTNLVNCTEIKGEGLLEKAERATCKGIFENGLTGVTATTELVANSKNPAILNLTGLLTTLEPALTLPVRVHLNNPLLGSGCYIGSDSHPIQLHLTDGTTSPPPPNKPISGKVGTPVEEEEENFGVLAIHENSLVDNAFSAPVAEGCGGIFAFLIDPILDAKIGLPSAAGHNTAILTGTTRAVASQVVKEHE
jgi:hypothetical protein